MTDSFGCAKKTVANNLSTDFLITSSHDPSMYTLSMLPTHYQELNNSTPTNFQEFNLDRLPTHYQELKDTTPTHF